MKKLTIHIVCSLFLLGNVTISNAQTFYSKTVKSNDETTPLAYTTIRKPAAMKTSTARYENSKNALEIQKINFAYSVNKQLFLSIQFRILNAYATSPSFDSNTAFAKAVEYLTLDENTTYRNAQIVLTTSEISDHTKASIKAKIQNAKNATQAFSKAIKTPQNYRHIYIKNLEQAQARAKAAYQKLSAEVRFSEEPQCLKATEDLLNETIIIDRALQELQKTIIKFK